MFKRLAFFVVCSIGLVSAAAHAQDRHGNHVPDVPAKLVVDDGYSPFLIAHAVGTQNYMCVPTTTGVGWRLFGPQATLFDESGDALRPQLATHFLSANPDEGGLARPSWQHSIDSSRVWGRMLQSSDDANFVAPGAIPWLLLMVTGRDSGPVGGGILTQAEYIHRVNTAGGMAPASGCMQPTDLGATALVPYEADYVFYRSRGAR